jgi:hypothetical protein
VKLHLAPWGPAGGVTIHADVGSLAPRGRIHLPDPVAVVSASFALNCPLQPSRATLGGTTATRSWAVS